MDMSIIDVTNIPDVRPGDTATLFGCDGENSIPVEELAEKAGTISYEIICELSGRVGRRYDNFVLPSE